MTIPTAPTSVAGSRILVVEDEAIIAEEIHDRLTRLGVKVVGVEDTGEEAIYAASRTRPDLVLMDVRLKGEMDGIEAATHIRTKVDIPIVYLTAHSDRTTAQRAKETAAFGYILKPFQERELEVTIEMAMHRHGLERRLRESELRYAATLASIGDGVLATDETGGVTFMNAVAESLTGWRLEEAQAHAAEQILTLIDERTREHLASPIAKALESRGTVWLGTSTMLVSRDGTTIPIDDSAAPIIDANGNVCGVVVAFRDVRHKRMAEQALAKAGEELRRAQKLESIGQLAAGVAHDFNNFLTVINGCGEMLLGNGALSRDDAELVGHILSASERSAALARQLLAFSRRQVLNPKVLDLNVLVTDTERLLRRLIGEHIQMHVALRAETAYVRADPGQVEQIIINLAVNARDAMPDGGKLLIETSNFVLTESTTETKPSLSPGRYVMLTVTDTGRGMDEATKARLFEPFFTTKEVGRGTGLGLATVYGIVRQSGGAIYVYSEPERGSVFKIYLPAASEAPQPGGSDAAAPAPYGHETVLLVEDDDGVRQVAASALRGHGYTVHGARSGAEAMEIYDRNAGAIDALVSDTIMPGMSGPRLAERIAEKRAELPVLLLSGYSDPVVEEALAKLSNAQFLQKPFTPAALAGKVREILDKAASKG